MTQDQIDRIKAYCEKATPGPWRYECVDGEHQLNGPTIPRDGMHDEGDSVLYRTCYDYDNDDANLSFCASARTDLPLLLQQVERLMAENSEMREIIDRNLGEIGLSAASGTVTSDWVCPQCRQSQESEVRLGRELAIAKRDLGGVDTIRKACDDLLKVNDQLRQERDELRRLLERVQKRTFFSNSANAAQEAHILGMDIDAALNPTSKEAK